MESRSAKPIAAEYPLSAYSSPAVALGAVGTDAQSTASQEYDAAYWQNHCAKIEKAARAADPVNA